jgi:hypothetical protein
MYFENKYVSFILSDLKKCDFMDNVSDVMFIWPLFLCLILLHLSYI